MSELPGWLKHATVWLLLAVGLFLGVQTWQHQAQRTQIEVMGNVVEIRRGSDGHYHWPGEVAGQPVDFLVDTGATGTAIPTALARQLGLPVVGRVRSNTAGGVVEAEVVVGDLRLQGGLRAERLRMAALANRVPYTTTLSAANAVCDAITARRARDPDEDDVDLADEADEVDQDFPEGDRGPADLADDAAARTVHTSDGTQRRPRVAGLVLRPVANG